MFYDRFLKLCQERNIAPSRAATEAGLSKSTVSKWKNEPSSEPSGSVLKKLSEYFGIGVSEILDEKPVDSSPAVIMGFGGPGQITVPDKKKSDKHQELLQLLDGLSDEQINVLIQVAQSMK